MAYPRGTSVSAYQSVATHGGVAASDPHGLVLMLLDGALERLSAARGCMEHHKAGEKVRLLHRVIEIVDELRGSLDLSAGGEVAKNLSELYDYIARQLFKANLENNASILAEVSSLLRTIRSAWSEIPSAARSQRAP
jgi:flagellar protein FliS